MMWTPDDVIKVIGYVASLLFGGWLFYIFFIREE